MTRTISETEVRAMLAKKVAELGSASAVARAAGISRQYICDVLHRRRPIGPKLHEYLGYRVVTRIERYSQP